MARSNASDGVSLNPPFLAFVNAVLLTHVITTSSGDFFVTVEARDQLACTAFVMNNSESMYALDSGKALTCEELAKVRDEDPTAAVASLLPVMDVAVRSMAEVRSN